MPAEPFDLKRHAGKASLHGLAVALKVSVQSA